MQSSSRGSAQVIWICLHTTEGIMRATDLRAWTSWPGSSHAANDETGVLLDGAADGFVDYSRASWTLRNGNPYSDNLEQCGFARWSRAEWLSRPKLLDTSAKWIASRHKARPWIPITKRSPSEVAARKPGVIGHADYTFGTGDGTHWDPGPNYPWDVVIDKARAYAGGIHIEPEDDMFEHADAVRLSRVENAVNALIGVSERPLEVERRLSVKLDALTEVVRQLATRQGTPIDMAAVERVVEKGVADAIAAIDTTVRFDTPPPAA